MIDRTHIGRLILEASTGIHGDCAKQLAKELVDLHDKLLTKDEAAHVNALVGLHAMKRVRQNMVKVGHGHPNETVNKLATQAHNYRKELETLIERVTR